jgi:hypothetical protein
MFQEKSSTLIKLSLGLLFSFTMFLGSALGESTASVSGLVKDQNEAVVAGATVIVGSKGSGNVTTTTTDGNGKYEIKNLSAGQYLITVKKGGFSDSQETVSLNGGESITQDFSISPGGLREEVTITAAKGLRSTSEMVFPKRMKNLLRFFLRTLTLSVLVRKFADCNPIGF